MLVVCRVLLEVCHAALCHVEMLRGDIVAIVSLLLTVNLILQIYTTRLANDQAKISEKESKRLAAEILAQNPHS